MWVQSCIMEQWLGDLYDVQGMDSLSGLLSKRIGICNIAFERLHIWHIPLLTRHVILHSRYIYTYATHQHIEYTPGIHTHTHNLANCNPIYTITHRNIHKQTLGIYTYTHDKYTTSCRYTYTRNIYTYALSIDNYTPGNYKYRRHVQHDN